MKQITTFEMPYLGMDKIIFRDKWFLIYTNIYDKLKQN